MYYVMQYLEIFYIDLALITYLCVDTFKLHLVSGFLVVKTYSWFSCMIMIHLENLNFGKRTTLRFMTLQAKHTYKKCKFMRSLIAISLSGHLS